jgi:hypothetical protein
MTGRPSIFGIAWAVFMTLIVSPVIVFDVLTIVHWRADKIVAFITLPLLAAALWGFWTGALPRRPAPPTEIGAFPPKAVKRERRRR